MSIETMKLALDFVEWFARDDHSVRPVSKAPEIAQALRQAIEQKQEPCRHRIADITNEAIKSGYMCMDCGALFGAYTSPPQRHPLTDEQIGTIATESQWGFSPHDDTLRFARAIEATHGIKGEA